MTASSEPFHEPDVFERLMRETRLGSSLGILFSQAVAERLGVHSTDIETMDLLNIFGPMTAGQLSEKTGLSTGATTRLIDRMERAGFVRRRADSSDRRRVVVEFAEDAFDRIWPYFESLARQMEQLWSSYSVEDLAIVLDFMAKSNDILARENARLRGPAE